MESALVIFSSSQPSYTLTFRVCAFKFSHCIRKSNLSGLWLNMLKTHWSDMAWPLCGTAPSTPSCIIKHIIICTGIFKWLIMKAESKGGEIPCLETSRKGMNKTLSWFDLRGNHFREEQSPDANMSARLLKLCHDELYRQLKTGQINANSVGAIF